MRYVPDLIPKQFKVLPYYFQGSIYESKNENLIVFFLNWVLGCLFFLGALFYIAHPLVSFFLILIGLLLIPPGINAIQKALRFKMNNKIKLIAITVLLIGFYNNFSYYNKIDKVEENNRVIAEKKEQEKKLREEKLAKERKDSINLYIKRSQDYTLKNKSDKALNELNKALRIANYGNETSLVQHEISQIKTKKALSLVKAGNYKKAIPELNSLISENPNNSNLIYNRALCLSKTGQIKNAVDDCRRGLQLNNKDAEKLYNKINPVRKRISYYITRCCDGTTSSATGRGACSHHGGVCDWNEPVYEEYRKY